MKPEFEHRLHRRVARTTSTIDVDVDIVDSGVSTPSSTESVSPRPMRSCRISSTTPLTEEALIKLQASFEPYFSTRILDRWSFYIESITQDFFDTYHGLPDYTYRPRSRALAPLSETPLSEADTSFESYHSLASSTDLFGWRVATPEPPVQVVVRSHSVPPYQLHTVLSSSSSDNLSEPSQLAPQDLLAPPYPPPPSHYDRLRHPREA